MNFNEKLRQARKAKGITQEDLADEIGSHPASVSNYETGRSMPSTLTLIDLCEVLDVSADWLLGLKDCEENA